MESARCRLPRWSSCTACHSSLKTKTQTRTLSSSSSFSEDPHCPFPKVVLAPPAPQLAICPVGLSSFPLPPCPPVYTQNHGLSLEGPALHTCLVSEGLDMRSSCGWRRLGEWWGVGGACGDRLWASRAKTCLPRAHHPEKLGARAEATLSSAHMFAWLRATQSSVHSHPMVETSLELSGTRSPLRCHSFSSPTLSELHPRLVTYYHLFFFGTRTLILFRIMMG